MAATEDGIKGEQLLEVSNAISSLFRECYGRGPQQSKAYVLDDVLVVRLHGGLTRVEETLIAGGRADLVREVRLAFQEMMADTFKGTVTEVVGRRVVGYSSQIEFATESTFEIFELEGEPAS